MNWRDTSHPRAGGAETVTLEHAKRWVKKGHRVTWLTSGSKGAPSEEKKAGVHMVRRGGSLSIYLVAPWYYLFHKKEFSVIVDEIHGIPFFTPLYSKTPTVAFIHEIAKEIWDYSYPFPISAIGKTIEKLYLLLYRKTMFWTDAQSTIDDLVREGIPREHCVAIPCPVSVQSVTAIPQKETNPTFLYVSRLVPMKGVEYVIEAFFSIVNKLPDATLWIVGGGDATYISKVKKKIQKFGLTRKIHLFGKVSDKEKLAYMRRAHILLHASVREGWGLVVLEAASQGTPAVVYDVSGLRDVVNRGNTGVITKTNTPHAMAHEATDLWNDQNRYKKLQKEAHRWVSSLNWDRAASDSLMLLTRVMEKKS